MASKEILITGPLNFLYSAASSSCPVWAGRYITITMSLHKQQVTQESRKNFMDLDILAIYLSIWGNSSSNADRKKNH